MIGLARRCSSTSTHAAGDVEQAAHYLLQAAGEAVTALAFDRAARLCREALAIHDQTGTLAADAHDARGRLAHALASASRASEAANVYFELARDSAAGGDEDLSLRCRRSSEIRPRLSQPRGLAPNGYLGDHLQRA